MQMWDIRFQATRAKLLTYAISNYRQTLIAVDGISYFHLNIGKELVF